MIDLTMKREEEEVETESMQQEGTDEREEREQLAEGAAPNESSLFRLDRVFVWTPSLTIPVFTGRVWLQFEKTVQCLSTNVESRDTRICGETKEVKNTKYSSDMLDSIDHM